VALLTPKAIYMHIVLNYEAGFNKREQHDGHHGALGHSKNGELNGSQYGQDQKNVNALAVDRFLLFNFHVVSP
jgi:hypothetical protein